MIMQNYNFKDLHTIEKKACVYQIINILNNNRYIGSTINLKSRAWQHIYLLRKNKHHSVHLQNAYNKYGEDKFVFNILEECQPIKDTLLLLEQKYLDLLPEYNTAQLATCPAQLHQSVETKEKRASKLRGKKRTSEQKQHLSQVTINKIGKLVDQFDMEGNYLRTFNSSAQAARFCGDFTTRGVAIQQCCKGYGKSYKNYQWRWNSDRCNSIGEYKNNSMNMILNSRKQIIKLTLDGRLLKKYNSISDAARDLKKENVVSACSNIVQCAKGNKNQAYGFKWKYQNDK